MATGPLTPAQVELISSLSQDEIPIKLRCAICSKLAVNAFRLPCCEQAICENCQSTLPSSCPVCEHTPVAAEDCKPNKSLRTTIKVFLRTEEKKREALRLKDLKDTPPDTPATPITPVEAVAVPVLPSSSAPAIAPKAEDEAPQPASLESSTGGGQDWLVSATNPVSAEIPTESQQDIPQPSIEEIAPGQEPTVESNATNNEAGDVNAEVGNGQLDLNGLTEKDANGQPMGLNGMPQPLGFGVGYGFDGTTTPGFPNMGLMGQGTDFNQMQMMMAMQNGMAPNAFGAFPMMGMSGMTMDPMAMQNMYMNGGFGVQGMGINGMNMGMGIGGYDGGVGSGFNNGWNGQQSWNVGQDNFNHPNAASMGHGDYGANNTGFHATNYNQGNYGRSNQYNDYQQNGYGHQNQGNFFRGRGRGRGYGYGSNRGGHGYGQNDPYSQSHFQGGGTQGSAGPVIDRDSIPSGPKADMASVPPASNVDEFGREIRQLSEEKVSVEAVESRVSGDIDAAAAEPEHSGPENPAQQDENVPERPEQEDDTPKPIQTLEQIESESSLRAQAPSLNGIASPSIPLAPSGPSGRGQSIPRGGFHVAYNDRNGSASMQPPNISAAPKVIDIPINAPTGPKAMREGLPNTSLVNLRGRGGFPMVGRGGLRQSVLHTETTTSTAKSRSLSPLKEKETDRGRDGDNSRSPSEDRDRGGNRRSDKHRKRRYRSTSESEDEKNEERRSDRHRRRHRHRSTSPSEDEESRRERRRKRKHDEQVVDANKEHELAGEERRVYDDEVERSRSQSPTESRRSSHRSRRDRDRDREKDRDREHKSSSHKHRSSHRSHRDRSRSRERDRDRDRDRERRHRHRHDSLSPKDKEAEPRPSAVVEAEKPDVKIPSGPRAMTMSSGKAHKNSTNGIEIKGVSARRQSIQEAPVDDRLKFSSSAHDVFPTAPSESRKGKDRDRDRDRDADRSRGTATEQRSSREYPRQKDEPRSAVSTKFPDAPPSATPTIDVHTLEREARNRERLLKEAQRIAGLAAASSGGRKRSRDEISGPGLGGDEGRNGSGRSGRKHRRGAGEREGDEERIARLETEREAGRWD